MMIHGMKQMLPLSVLTLGSLEKVLVGVGT